MSFVFPRSARSLWGFLPQGGEGGVLGTLGRGPAAGRRLHLSTPSRLFSGVWVLLLLGRRRCSPPATVVAVVWNGRHWPSSWSWEGICYGERRGIHRRSSFLFPAFMRATVEKTETR